jgi:hypothetical protein
MPKPLKWILWTAGTLAALALAAIALIATIFSDLIGEPSRDEVVRVISPSGNIEAVLLETNGGATTSFGYEVFVVERGAKPSGSPAVSLYGAIRNSHAYGANLKWSSPASLAVEYLSAKSAKLNAPTQLIAGQTVQLTVQDGITDSSAPSGGMLYNLRNKN